MKSFNKILKWRPAAVLLSVALGWLMSISVAFGQERTMPAGASAYTEIIEVGDSAPVLVPSIWNTATVMVRQIEGGDAAFRAAIGTATIDARLPLIKNITASFRSSGYLALQAETGTATLVVYRVMQSERALTLDEGVLSITLPSAEVAADLATDSIGLIDAVNAVAAACASETSLVSSINAITSSLAGVISVESDISTDSIGLISAINAVAEACASETAVTAAIDAVKNELAQPTESQEQMVSLSANTATDIISEIVGRRNDIVIRAQDPDKQYWISTEGAAGVGTSIPVRDWVRIRLPKNVTISAISSEALDLSVFESGW